MWRAAPPPRRGIFKRSGVWRVVTPFLKISDGVRLVYLPPYSPRLQPAETLSAHSDEPIVNKHIATITELDARIARLCIVLAAQREKIPTRTGFHWPPKPITPN
ncbi:MAG: hypothetical protein ACREC0_14460 [Methylocella sp.]